ncbi:MAG TPA: AmmeMemoRadiSam system protein B, partial [Phycisphaerae bacterium]|nr:AmmeMemoRadiSam system protein B [Phycisphaerae bacterium]
MMIREAEFAGRFYAATKDACLTSIESCLERTDLSTGVSTESDADRIIGGIVPHAGWAYSGPIAVRVIREIASRPHPQTVIVFGAIHVLHGNMPTVFGSG